MGKAKYVTSKVDGKTYCKTNGQFKKHLLQANISEQEYFERYIGEAPKCICGASRKMSISDWTFLPTCGAKCKNEYLRILKTETWNSDKKAAVNAKVSEGVRRSNTSEKIAYQTSQLRAAIADRGKEIKAKRRATSLSRHGDPTYSNPTKASATRKSFDSSKRARIYESANRTKEQRYGSCKMQASKMLKYKNPEYWKPIVSSIRTTCQKRYGQNWLPMKILATHSQGPVSKAERRFVQMLLDNGIHGESCLSKNGQWSIKTDQRSYFFDFAVPELNKLIEFNGDFWHANPKRYKHDQVISFGSFKAKAEDLWSRDAKKVQAANDQGYQVLTVWESDFNRNPTQEIQRCISWLAE